jgi:dTDP-4-dehydrorhamnose reductase
VDLCETNPTQAYNVNVLGVENISKYAKIHGIPVTYISSSAVFGNDGKKWRYCELDFPNPSNLYGCSKLAGEKVVQSLVPDGLIVRSSWMIGGGPLRDKKFIAKILPKLKDNLELSVVHDKYGALTYAKDLADFLLIAHNNNYAGILHYASSDYTSRYDISQYVAKLVGSKSNITGIDSSTFPLNAPRAFSEALYSLLPCYQRKDWKTIIKEYIQEWQ